MSCIRKQAMLEPLVDTVDANQIVTNAHLLKVCTILDSSMLESEIDFHRKILVPRCLPELVKPWLHLQTMDISKMRTGETSFSAPFKLVASRNDFIHALVAYFDVSFTKCHKPTSFSTGTLGFSTGILAFLTCRELMYPAVLSFFHQLMIFGVWDARSGPKSRPTHWKQTVLYLEDVITICEGEALTGTLSVSPSVKNPRDLDIVLVYKFVGKRCRASREQHFRMR